MSIPVEASWLSGVPKRKRALHITRKNADFKLVREDDIAYLPFAHAVEQGMKPDPVSRGDAIPYLLPLLDHQVGPAMIMKNRLLKNGHALLAFGCGEGKTATAIWGISQLSPSLTLIVTHRDTLYNQWKKEVLSFTGEEPWIADVPEDVGEGARVVVVMVHVMRRLPQWLLENVDLMIVDECHDICGPVFSISLLYATPKMVLGLSATPGDLDGEIDPVVSLIYGKQPITTGVVKPMKVIRILTPYRPRIEMKWLKGKMRVNWGVVVNSLTHMETRNRYIGELVRFLVTHDPDNRVAVLCKRAIQASTLLPRVLTTMGFKQEVDFDTAYGRKMCKWCPIIVGTGDKIGVGFDEKGCEGFDGRRINHIILAMDSIDVRQWVGRGRRANRCTVWELLDNHELIREVHAGERKTWYTSTGAEVVTISQEDLVFE